MQIIRHPIYSQLIADLDFLLVPPSFNKKPQPERYLNYANYFKNCVTLILLDMTTFISGKLIHMSNIKKMKIMIFLIVLTIPLNAGIMLTGSQLSTQGKRAAQDTVQDTKKDLTAAQKSTNTYKVAQKESTAEEWKKFNKSDFELKIKANEMRITKLNVKIRKPAELFDPLYLKKIADLEKENLFLKARLEAYEKSQHATGSI